MSHRYSYIANHGPIPPGMLVRHKCDNPPCVRPDHLEIGTHADNSRDMMVRGRHRTNPDRGEDQYNALFTEKQVLEIREKARASVALSDIAKEYGAKPHTIFAIVRGASWRHLPFDPPKRRGKRGSANERTKLTDDQVREIRSAWASGETQAAIAARYGVKQPCIYKIVHRLTRKHVR